MSERHRRLVALALALAAASPVPVNAAAAESDSLAGQLLVAAPEMRDPRFKHTVIYMVRHDRLGAMGLVLNRPVGEVPLAKVLERLGLANPGATGDVRVHYGGPVEPTRGFVLHTADYAGAGTVVVGDGIALTENPAIFGAIGAATGPRKSVFALGYAGWRGGQLEAELERGIWRSVPADEALVFDDDYDRKWQRALDKQIIHL